MIISKITVATRFFLCVHDCDCDCVYVQQKDSVSVGEEVMAQVRAELTQEKERAVEEERQRWQSRLDHEMHQLKLRADAEKQVSYRNH